MTKNFPSFFPQKMCNILKRMQKQFSNFFRLTKILILSFWDLSFYEPDSETQTSDTQ